MIKRENGEKGLNDSCIVDLYLRRDESAVWETANAYGNSLRCIASGILGDVHIAEECEQDAYLEAWNSIPPKEPREYLFAYLGRIVRNIAIDRSRRLSAQKRSAAVVELTKEMQECQSASSNTEHEFEARELSRTINAFLSTQKPQQRTIFIKRYWFFESVSEIAAELGCSESKVKTTLMRMREKLKANLTEEGWQV